MIKVDISNVWGQISLPDLLAVEHEVAAAHQTLAEGTGAGNDFLGWLDLPVAEETKEMKRIQKAADQIRANSDVFVVVGIGGSYLGPRAAIELMQGCNHNIGKGKGDPQIYFAGNTLSTRAWNELQRLLEGKDFSLAVISKSGTTTEPAIAFRALKWMLERKYGTTEAAKRIYAITDPAKGALRQEKRGVYYYSPLISEAEYNGWATNALIDRLYNGSARALVAALVHSEGLTQSDIEELRALFKVED